MKECIVAKSAGFCFGVSRSVKMAEEMLAAEQNCYSLGELIHNDDVVRHLQSEGLTVVDGPEQIPQGASVIIRSHGVSRAEFEAVQRTGAAVYDATCPKVKRIHEIVAEASAEGRQPVIIGAADHPEVRAICGWCAAPVVVNDAAELAHRRRHHRLCKTADCRHSDDPNTRETAGMSENHKKTVYKRKIV